MIFRIILIFLFLYSSIAFAGNLPDTLYQIKLGDSINNIKGTRKAGSMLGLYRIPFDEKQLVDPPNKFLLVKVHRNNSRINSIIGESVSTKKSCPTDAKKLKNKYEKLYGIQLEQRKGDKDLNFFSNIDEKYFIIQCAQERKEMMLRVILADASDKYKDLNERVKLDVATVDRSLRKLLSAWSTDCDNQKNNNMFVLESYEKNTYTISLCSGFKCILYPGFKEPFDVYNDKRIEWISVTEMKISNKRLWKGSKTFHRCLEY